MDVSQNGSFPIGIVHLIRRQFFRRRWACFPPSEQCLCTANDIETDGLLFVSSRRHRQPNCPLIAPEDFYLVEEKEVLVGAVGIEPTTFGLKGRCSTTELRP